MSQVYREEDFKHGLTCMDCGHVFTEGEQISERLDGVSSDPEGENVAAFVDLVCVPCGLGIA